MVASRCNAIKDSIHVEAISYIRFERAPLQPCHTSRLYVGLQPLRLLEVKAFRIYEMTSG